MKKIVFGGSLILALAGGCAHTPPARPAPLPAAEAFPAPAPAAAGSLWVDGETGLFSDLKARRVGDLLTVAIYERASASKEAKTKTGRDSTASADLTRVFGLERNIATINKTIDPTQLISANYQNEFDGFGSTSRKEDLVATISTRVVELYPNGNLRITGRKQVTVNNEDQIIELTGIVRPADITSENFVDSKYILDADIAYTGKGVISDKQKQGWMVRILDNIWPF